MYSFIFIVACCVLMIATYTDLKKRVIPNVLVYGGAMVVMLMHMVAPVYPIGFYVLGLVPAACMSILFFFSPDKVGGGDVKLFLFLGLALGGVGPTIILVFTTVFIFILQLIFLVLKNKQKSFPMAPFVLISFIVFVIGW
ncbi:prepilin peptidase [Longirhabdus pacifica]|uniref:prepilin peptidase n=1 Tax=Longirhabdus pacifica TaxID=2305227 RepID=UPI001008C831|nr:prepilin peptidase [Longirhabdus pacifica]